MPFSKRKLFYCLSNIMNKLLLICQQYCNILWSNTDWPGTLQTTNSVCNQQTIMFWNISLILPSTSGVRFNFTWRNYNKWAETKVIEVILPLPEKLKFSKCTYLQQFISQFNSFFIRTVSLNVFTKARHICLAVLLRNAQFRNQHLPFLTT